MKAGALALALCASASLYGGVIGSITPTPTELVATGGEVIVYFAGHTAAYESVLNVFEPCCIGPFFRNHVVPVGGAFSLGTFDAGTILRVRLDVLSTGRSFTSGAGASNPDGLVHVAHANWAADATIPVDGIWVGFEDMYGGGDLDYDDNSFVFTQVASPDVASTPEPASLTLFGSALIAVSVWGMRRKQKV